MDAGYYRYCLIGGFAFQIIGIFMISLCKQYWQVFLAQGLCCGIGDGLFFCPTTALIATYFVKKGQAIALGFTLSGSSTRGLIFPTLVRQLLPKIGFKWTVRCIVFVVLFCFIICLAQMYLRRNFICCSKFRGLNLLICPNCHFCPKR